MNRQLIIATFFEFSESWLSSVMVTRIQFQEDSFFAGSGTKPAIVFPPPVSAQWEEQVISANCWLPFITKSVCYSILSCITVCTNSTCLQIKRHNNYIGPSNPVFHQPYMWILMWVAPPSHGTLIGRKWVLKLKTHTCGWRYWAIQGS